MIIVREYVRIGKPPSRVKIDFPVNWWEFIKDDEWQGRINLYCFDCTKEKIPKHKVSRIIKAGEIGDRCYLCLKVKNVPEYKFADKSPYQTIEEWTDEDEPIPPVEHIVGDFTNALTQVELDTDLYGYCQAIEHLDAETLLEIWQEYCRNGRYIRPDVLTAALSDVFEDQVEIIKEDLKTYDVGDKIQSMAWVVCRRMLAYGDDENTVSREKLIYRYVQAMDTGDMESLDDIFEAALNDPELDRIINEINLAYVEEENSLTLDTKPET